MAYETIGLGTSANDGTGDDLRTAGGKINDNFAKAIENNKVVIPAAAMLPMTTASAYYLESDTFPAQVFSATVNQYCKFQLFDVGNQIPAAANAIKLKFWTTSASAGDVVLEGYAAWVNESDAGVTYGQENYITTGIVDGELNASSQTPAITPSGTRTAGCGLWVKIGRKSEEATDDLADTMLLVWVELEFVTV